MATFNVKQVSVPLFGVVEADDKEQWHTDFASTGKIEAVSIDTAVLEFIADELELDADGLMVAAARYVRGDFRPKAHGIGGSQLGDLGEVLTFVINRAQPGRRILRVFSWDPESSPVKDGKFPQPDFIVRENGQQFALEVKSTEAFDYQQLFNTPKKWLWLQPCSFVAARRVEALGQLGYSGQALTPQKHSLKIQNGEVVPFPTDEGTAVVVLVHDGRVSNLRTNSKYRTPPDCREANPTRDCWSCVSESHEAVVVSMPNAPGWLSLGGYGKSDDQGRWFQAYQRWTQALRTREILAAREASVELVTTVNAWLNVERPGEDGQILRAFWGSYIGDALRNHGLNVNLDENISDLGKVDPDFNWKPASMAEPPVREGRLEEIQSALAEGLESAVTRWLSVNVSGGRKETETLAFGLTEQAVVFNFISHSWWHRSELERDDDASRIAARLVSLAIDAWRSTEDGPRPRSIPLRRVAARVGKQEILFGWRPDAGPNNWLPRWVETLEVDPLYLLYHDGPSWLHLLATDDSRVRLRIHRDGRADLRVLRSVWR